MMIGMTRDQWLEYCKAEAEGNTELMKRLEEANNGMDNIRNRNSMSDHPLGHLEADHLGNGQRTGGEE